MLPQLLLGNHSKSGPLGATNSNILPVVVIATGVINSGYMGDSLLLFFFQASPRTATTLTDSPNRDFGMRKTGGLGVAGS